MAPNASSARAPIDGRNRRVGLIALSFAVLMLGMGYIAVPLYRMFCQATGFNGTPQRATALAASHIKVLDRTMSIRFDSNIDPGMPWRFHPEATTATVRIGARAMALFDAENTSDHAITGSASYNIQPDEAARYFTKVQCFCFTQQTLAAHQSVRMPVIYFVNPKIVDDPDLADVRQITLSYTFHPVAQSASGQKPAV